jgi:hypothetical protein
MIGWREVWVEERSNKGIESGGSTGKEGEMERRGRL